MGLQWALIMMSKQFMMIEQQLVSFERCENLTKVIQEKKLDFSQVPNFLLRRPMWPERGEIVFSNVHLRYRPTTEVVLNNLSFKAEAGQKIGIVGRTGAGKSTICLCLSRIVEIFKGKIKVDGLDISMLDLDELRKRITVIPQDPTMFNGTLRFNLDPLGNARDSEIVELLKKATLTSLLQESKPLDKVISEGGSNMSSGEKQLICICRAILRKSKVIILDEATANIDIVTEQKIQQLITENFKDSTMLVVAHRLNTIINSDKVLVMEDGKNKEFDSPQALMANPESEFSKLLQEIK